MPSGSLLPDGPTIHRADAGTETLSEPGSVIATEDHELIRRWASERQAEPATGEATASGPKTIDVRDGDAGIRFNFPGSGRFRVIDWDEWFENFARYNLVFIYERNEPGKTPSSRYRLIPRHDLDGRYRA